MAGVNGRETECGYFLWLAPRITVEYIEEG
jgi:hypothetical protein